MSVSRQSRPSEPVSARAFFSSRRSRLLTGSPPSHDNGCMNWRQPKRWYLAAVAAVALAGAVVLAAFFGAFAPDDFTAKYQLIRPGMTRAEAMQLLGPCDTYQLKADNIYGWRSSDHARLIMVTWDASGRVSDKNFVILSEPPRWWERAFKSVGLR
jgi:hypothetical protein